ncbi:MAG: hypothetical protein C4574_00640 [Candidatus Latescibacterota bacterium]|nr:MAG: hypothetical protein C4574_00640 [Candidatus Latescibacterota bacterium]
MDNRIWIKKISVLSLSGRVGPGKPFAVPPDLADKYLAKRVGGKPVYQKVDAPATAENMAAILAENARMKAELEAKKAPAEKAETPLGVTKK